MEQRENLSGKRVLVTGASGFLGRHLVARLVAQGCQVRALVRSRLKVKSLTAAGAETVVGDVTDLASLRPVFAGVDGVVHAAADTSGTWEGVARATIDGTRNMLELCDEFRVSRLVYISSCAVYGLAGFAEGEVVAETAALESRPEIRGSYSWGKCEAEKLVRDAMEQATSELVCLRPGMLYGPGGDCYPPMLGFSLADRLFLVIDNGRLGLPLVHVDNLVEAIWLALVKPAAGGKIYNVVDPELVDKRRYMDHLVRKLNPGARCLYLPYRWVFGLTRVQERLFSLLRRKPLLSCYRLQVSQQPIIYDTSRICRELGWRPLTGFDAAVRQLLEGNIASRTCQPGAGGRDPAVGRTSKGPEPIRPA